MERSRSCDDPVPESQANDVILSPAAKNAEAAEAAPEEAPDAEESQLASGPGNVYYIITASHKARERVVYHHR